MDPNPVLHFNRIPTYPIAFKRVGLLHWVMGCLSICAMSFVVPALAQDNLAQDNWSEQMKQINPAIGEPFKIDEERVLAAGIRKLSGKHITLYTDVRETKSAADKKINELVDVFDQAVAQWCKYFDVDVAKAVHWKMRVFLIANEKDTSNFQKAGLIPDDLHAFRAGYQSDHDAWLYLQPGTYYTRHLMLHEGTHGFMQWFSNGYGAPWYSEGMAEVLGVHRWADGKLNLRYRLRDRSDAPYWGRVKRIKDEYDVGEDMSLSDVLNIPPTAFLEVRYYAWSWAACEFFSKHERTKVDFAAMKNSAHVGPKRFNQKFERAIKANWEQLENDWELFIAEMEYGYQPQRGRITNAKTKEATFGSGDAKFTIRSDQSWQKTSVAVKKGDRFRVTGKGEFKVGQSASESTASDSNHQPWPCQSNGITIEYHRGNPLGILQAGVLSTHGDSAKERVKGLVSPVSIGLMAEITATHDGILCLRINESPARLGDNEGALEVIVEKLE